MEHIFYGRTNSFLCFQVLGLGEIKHLFCPIVNLKHNLMNDRLSLFPNQDNPPIRSNPPQILNPAKDTLNLPRIITPHNPAITTLHISHRGLTIKTTASLLNPNLSKPRLPYLQYHGLIHIAERLNRIPHANDLRDHVHYHEVFLLVDGKGQDLEGLFYCL